MCLESWHSLLESHVVHEEVAGLEFGPDTGPRANSIEESEAGNGFKSDPGAR